MARDKEKARWARILRVYGLTKEQYDELDLGFCPICLRPWDDTVIPVVDHRHSSRVYGIRGFVRGVVCRTCNHRHIGKHTDPAMVGRIWSYLRDAPTHLIVPEKPKRKKRNGTKPLDRTRSPRTP